MGTDPRHPFYRGIMIHRALGITYPYPEDLLPDMDCESCVFRKPELREKAHCYMFREQPAGDKCGQYKKDDKS